MIDPRRFGGYWIVPQLLEAAAGIVWILISNYSWAQQRNCQKPDCLHYQATYSVQTVHCDI